MNTSNQLDTPTTAILNSIIEKAKMAKNVLHKKLIATAISAASITTLILQFL